MVMHEHEMSILQSTNGFMKLKSDSIGDPDIYFGARLKKVELDNFVFCWSLSPSKHVQEAVRNVEKCVKTEFGERFELTEYAPNLFPLIMALTRVDIATEVSTSSSYLAVPRKRHMQGAMHIMSYLRVKHNSRLAPDPSYPEVNMAEFHDERDWTKFYGDVKEAIPYNAPKPREKGVDLRMCVASDHAGNKANRRSRTGLMIFLNMSLISWLSKRQATVEDAVFGSEFVALKQGMKTLRGIRYKLRMMGVPIDGPSYVYGDNMSVVNNTSKPETTLKKKTNSICYHFVREAVAMQECLTTRIPTLKNWADLLTKVLSGRERRTLVQGVLYCIYDYDD